jgi:hypothetical protein
MELFHAPLFFRGGHKNAKSSKQKPDATFFEFFSREKEEDFPTNRLGIKKASEKHQVTQI